MKSLFAILLAVISTTVFAESFTLCDGQSVCGNVFWRGKAGVTVEMDGADVFVEGEKICSPYYTSPCESCNTCAANAASAPGVTFLRGATGVNPGAERVLYEGRFVTREEKEADETRVRLEGEELLKGGARDAKFINEQLGKGLVPYYGKWVTLAEREQLRAEAIEKQENPAPSAAPVATPATAPATPTPAPKKLHTEWVNTRTNSDGKVIPGHFKIVKE